MILGYQLQKLGIDVIEVGFPSASESEMESVRKVAAVIRDSSIAAPEEIAVLLRDPLTFEPFDPERVGSDTHLEDRIIFGKFLGRNGLKAILEQDGIKISEAKPINLGDPKH